MANNLSYSYYSAMCLFSIQCKNLISNGCTVAYFMLKCNNYICVPLSLPTRFDKKVIIIVCIVVFSIHRSIAGIVIELLITQINSDRMTFMAARGWMGASICVQFICMFFLMFFCGWLGALWIHTYKYVFSICVLWKCIRLHVHDLNTAHVDRWLISVSGKYLYNKQLVQFSSV
jgi:hypothetical protein